MSGTLYVVSTPIGNLEDITLRALRVLREVDLVACEDTRQTRKLLDHYGIQKPMLSYHEHNEAARAEELIEKLRLGASVALVSDAGTPLISDPGYRLLAKAIAGGIPIEPIPGPSALVAALSASGLPTDSFRFGGFLPARSNARRKALAGLKDETATVVFYEAPHRILETLADIDETLGPRPVVLARELTKMHQEFLRGTAGELRHVLAARHSLKGEITLLIGRGAERPAAEESPIDEAVEARVRTGLSRMDAIKAVARERGLSKREVYRRMEKARVTAHPARPSGKIASMRLTPASDSLRDDHRRIEAQLDRLLAGVNQLTEARLGEVRQLFGEIRRLTSIHFRKEETVLYPRLRPLIPELLARMDEQHEYTRELERFLDELLSPGRELDHQRMTELRRFGIELHDSLRRHIVEEEDYLLRIADKELPAGEQQALFEEMRKAGG